MNAAFSARIADRFAGAHSPARVAFVATSAPRSASDPSGHFVAAEAQQYAAQHPHSEVWLIAPGAAASAAVAGRLGRIGVSDSIPATLGEWSAHSRLASRLLSPFDAAFGWPGLAARLRERPTRLVGAATFAQGAMHVLRTLSPQLVIAHWAIPCAWPLASKRLHAPHARWDLEIVSHGADVRLLLQAPRRLRVALVSQLLREARGWRFVSAALRDSLLKALPDKTAAAVLQVASVAAMQIEYPDVRKRASEIRAQRGDFWLSAGRLVASKRIDRCIMHASVQQRPLVVVGDGPEAAALRALAVQLRANVSLLGLQSRTETLAWIAASSGLLVASEAEGCSTVVREAAAYGVPVFDLAAAVASPG